jgi:hypothetical protein
VGREEGKGEWLLDRAQHSHTRQDLPKTTTGTAHQPARTSRYDVPNIDFNNALENTTYITDLILFTPWFNDARSPRFHRVVRILRVCFESNLS